MAFRHGDILIWVHAERGDNRTYVFRNYDRVYGGLCFMDYIQDAKGEIGHFIVNEFWYASGRHVLVETRKGMDFTS